MDVVQLDLTIRQGSTFEKLLRWESTPRIYKPISAIQKTAPVRLTVTGHGVPDGWRIAVESVVGMTELNAKDSPPRSTDMHPATVVDVNTLELNDVNAALFNAYVSGGFISYYTPVNLTGYTARMSIRERVGATAELLSLTTENARIVISPGGNTITLVLTPLITAAITWSRGVYDLEMVNGAIVRPLITGNVTVEKEVTV